MITTIIILVRSVLYVSCSQRQYHVLANVRMLGYPVRGKERVRRLEWLGLLELTLARKSVMLDLNLGGHYSLLAGGLGLDFYYLAASDDISINHFPASVRDG